MTTIIECQAFRATPLASGGIRLEIEQPKADALSEKMSLAEIAAAMGKSKQQIDKLSRRKHNPLPITRGCGHPFGLRSQINEWLASAAPTTGTPSLRGVLC